MNEYLTIALPKGRILEKITDYFNEAGITIREESRKLDYFDEKNKIRFLFVKNSDLPVYVNYGVADLGIVGSDVVYESEFELLRFTTFPFGKTKICLAGFEKNRELLEQKNLNTFVKEIKIATKFTKWTTNYFQNLEIPIKIIHLTGSIELAPILGLSDFIVDLVETGTTLKENNLAVIKELGLTEVLLIGNNNRYKLNYKRIDKLIEIVEKIG